MYIYLQILSRAAEEEKAKRDLVCRLLCSICVVTHTQTPSSSPCVCVLSSEDPSSGPHKITDKLFGNTRYFVMKSNNFENIEIAKDKVCSN